MKKVENNFSTFFESRLHREIIGEIMVILNTLGKIEKTYISKKLGLYISNLPNGEPYGWNNWQKGIIGDLKLAYEIGKINYDQYIDKYDNGPDNKFVENILGRAKNTIDEEGTEDEILSKYMVYLSQNMICVDIDYRASSIPDGEGSFSCFEGGTCEEDPVEKIIEFIHFVFSTNEDNSIKRIPHCVYSTSSQENMHYRSLFSFDGRNIENDISELCRIGHLIDNYLESEKDFYRLDYLCNAIYHMNIDEKSTYHYMKIYSLCALFLEKEIEIELDYKLPWFMDDAIPENRREGISELLRKIRNKIAHGDFEKVSELLEKYANEYMKGFWFDLSEHTKSSWVLIHISCLLESILRKIVYVMMVDKEKLREIRNMKKPQRKESKLLSYDNYMKRIFEIQSDCNHEAYLSEVILPVLKMCCTEEIKCVPVYDDRATGRKTENETPCKRRMQTICAKKEDGKYVVPDYIFVHKDYSFDNPQKPILMVETKNLNVKENKYRKLEDSIKENEEQLLAEIKSCKYVIYTDGVTWMFLENNEGKITQSEGYNTIELVELEKDTYKTYKYTQFAVSTKWKELICTIQSLLNELCNDKQMISI